MAIDFDKEEIEKLPPSQRLAKIKELKKKLQKQLEEESVKLEEDAKEIVEEEQNELETLLQEHIAEKRLDKERKSSELEETIRKENIEKQENQKKDIDYGNPTQENEQYKPAQDLNNNQYTPGQNNSFDANSDNDPLSEGKRDALGHKSNSLYK